MKPALELPVRVKTSVLSATERGAFTVRRARAVAGPARSSRALAEADDQVSASSAGKVALTAKAVGGSPLKGIHRGDGRSGAAAASTLQSPLFKFNILELRAASCTQAFSRLLDTTQKARIVFEPVFKPVIFGLESDQDARRFAVTRDYDLLP